MPVPEHLKHKPIIALNDYNTIDGMYAPDLGDAMALSIGQAQYDETEISAKVFRYTGQNWSRQSEELPIHRVLDLAIFVVASMQSENATISVSGQAATVIAPDRLQELLNYYAVNSNILQPRLDELRILLGRF